MTTRDSQSQCFLSSSYRYTVAHLKGAAVDNGGLLRVLDIAALRTSGLDSLDDVHGGLVGNLAEDDVAAIEPAGDNGGDEELRAVAGNKGEKRLAYGHCRHAVSCMTGHLRVGAGVGHGEETGLGVLELEVLIRELLAVDGLATGAL
jgi:hypothetical protein